MAMKRYWMFAVVGYALLLAVVGFALDLGVLSDDAALLALSP
jgi:hypothetical protein